MIGRKILLGLAGAAALSAGAACLYSDSFDRDSGDWYVEGGRSVAIRDGRLYIDADPEEFVKGGLNGGVCTVWNRTRIDGDVRVDFDVCVEHSVTGTNNINFFLFYSMPDGSSPEASTQTRKYADYADYHQLNGYIFTFLNASENKKNARIRIRRCPGFRLLRETYAGENRADTVYHITLIRQNGVLRFLLDGKELLSAKDEQPLEGGWFGFRTFRTRLWFDNLKITRLNADGAADKSREAASSAGAPQEKSSERR